MKICKYCGRTNMAKGYTNVCNTCAGKLSKVRVLISICQRIKRLSKEKQK